MVEQHRDVTIRRSYDPQAGVYRDEEIPTVTAKFQGRGRRALVRMPAGTAEGTFRLSGSHHDLAPGTYSFRLTRLSLGIAGDSGAGTQKFSRPWKGTVYYHYIRHSRQGTLLLNTFSEPEQRNILGDAMKPILSAGPGTLAWAWAMEGPGATGTRVSISQTLEGILG